MTLDEPQPAFAAQTDDSRAPLQRRPRALRLVCTVAMALWSSGLAPNARAQGGTPGQRSDAGSPPAGAAQPGNTVVPDGSVELTTAPEAATRASADDGTQAETAEQTDGASTEDAATGDDTGTPSTPKDTNPAEVPLQHGDAGDDAAGQRTDHSRFVDHLGIGLLGTRILGFGMPSIETTAPVIGGRFWLRDRMGIDAGVGISMAGASTSSGDSTTDSPEPYGIVLHGGLPLVILDAKHYAFEIVPEFDLGFAGNSTNELDVNVEYSAFLLALGARVGAELHFGFIDIPELALQAGVGLELNYSSTSATAGTTETTSSRWSFGTTGGPNPWDIFTSNIAALYYF